MHQLIVDADQKNNGDAALRIALFYKIVEHNNALTILWLRKAATLKNRSAQEMLLRIEPTQGKSNASPSVTPEKLL